jgi:DNA-binding transcriptional ArsR family regulator
MPTHEGAFDLAVLDAVDHPLRIRILRLGLDSFSPRTLTDHLDGVSVQLASYHVKTLAKAGLLKVDGTAKSRGATQTFYRVDEDAVRNLRVLSSAIGGVADLYAGRGVDAQPPLAS